MIRIKVRKKLFSSMGPIFLETDFTLPEKELVTLYGPSGAGKTTLIRMLAGLSDPDEGIIEVDGETWFDSARGIRRPAQERPISFVFQDYNLFPNMTVYENLKYALKDKKDQALIPLLLEKTGMSGFEGKKPSLLSGGQKQRIALIRAMLRKPKICLLDEPLSALDAEMRLKLQDEILSLHKEFGMTTLLVTHDLSEIFKLSTRTLVLEAGKIIRSGKPEEVFREESPGGNLEFGGNILKVEEEDFVKVVTLEVGNRITRVILSDKEAGEWKVGQRVIVSAKASSPSLIK